jgi:serine/threonine protein kinase
MAAYRYKHGDRPLEGYTIQRAVGRGGFGEVYYALSDSGREVALKAIQTYEQIELRGVTQCMNLKSPHLVSIFDIRRSAEDVPFVIMEYVSGPSLRELIDESPAGLGTQKAAFFLREMAKGLTFLHERGIVHRDLKPGNIFYEDGYVKIGDYGLSKMIAASQHSGQTITVGTVHYMAPEISQGRYDRSIDIYALGVCLYEMITGQTPYLGASPGEVLMKHLASEPDLTGIEEPFASAIRKGMAKNPAERFQTAQEMVEAVFGAEHIQNSVSNFRPESLSIAAERVAAKAAVGTGSSGNVAFGSPDLRQQGGPALDQTSSQVSQELNADGTFRQRVQGDRKDLYQEFGVDGRFQQKMERVRNRFDQKMERVSQRFERLDEKLNRRFGGARSEAAPETDLAPVPDPLDWNQRRILSVIGTAVVAAGIGLLGPRGLNPAWTTLLSFTLIAGAAGGIISARIKLLPKLESESNGLQRLATAGVGLIAGLLFSSGFLCHGNSVSDIGRADPGLIWGVFGVSVGLVYVRRRHRNDSLGRLIYLGPLIAAAVVGWLNLVPAYPDGMSPAAAGEACRRVFQGLLAVGAALFLIQWRRLTWPTRKERVSLGDALGAGAIAWIATIFLGGYGVVAAGIAAGIALAVQILAPYAPVSTRASLATGSGTQPAAAGSPPTMRPNAPAQASPNPMAGAYPAPQFGPAGSRTRSAPLRTLPGWLRVLCLLATIPLVSGGIVMLAWSGMENFRPEPFSAVVSIGIALLLLGGFTLLRGANARYRNVWTGAIKPLLMLACLESVIAAGVTMGNVHLNSDESLAGLFFIVFPAITFLVIAAIPNSMVAGTFSSSSAGAGPLDLATVSTRRRFPALVLAIIGFSGVSGLHRIYVGKTGTGILWLLTGGLLGIGTVVDVILIATGLFKDSRGRLLLIWHSQDELADSLAGPAAARTRATDRPAQDSPAPQPQGNTGAQVAEAITTASAQIAQSVAAGSESVTNWLRTRPGRLSSPASLTNWLRTRPRRQTNGFLAFIGTVLLLAGLLIGLGVAIKLPEMISAGVPDPGLATDLQREFGYAEWPRLASRVGMLAMWSCFVLSAVVSIFARRRAGISHAFRSVLACAGLLLTIAFLRTVFTRVDWTVVAGLVEAARNGPAIEYVLNTASSKGAICAAGTFILSSLLLAWPERRKTPALEAHETVG